MPHKKQLLHTYSKSKKLVHELNASPLNSTLVFGQKQKKEGAQGEKEEEAGGRRNAGSTGTPTPGADASPGSTQSGVWDARNRRKHG